MNTSMSSLNQVSTKISSIVTNTSRTCHSNLDDEGNPFYSYENAPHETPFNTHIGDACKTYHIKTKEDLFYEYVSLKADYDRSSSSTGIPGAYRYVKMKDFDADRYDNSLLAKDVRQKIINFIKNYKKFEYRGMGLYIHSPSTGAGKTLLACIIANGLIRQYNEQPRFIKATTFFEESKKAMRHANKDNPQYEDKMHILSQAKILIIDDLGADKATDYTSTLMYQLISKRTDLNKVTIITARRSLDELKYDASTINQIRSSTRLIELPNENIGAKVSNEVNKDLDELLKQL